MIWLKTNMRCTFALPASAGISFIWSVAMANILFGA